MGAFEDEDDDMRRPPAGRLRGFAAALAVAAIMVGLFELIDMLSARATPL